MRAATVGVYAVAMVGLGLYLLALAVLVPEAMGDALICSATFGLGLGFVVLCDVADQRRGRR